MNWIKVTYRVPEVTKCDFGYASEYYLVFFEDGYVKARLEGADKDKTYWYSPLFDDQIDEVTHWMPLPEPPKY